MLSRPPLTHNKLIRVQSSNPEEGKGGKQKGHQGVILRRYCGLFVCIPEQPHMTELSNVGNGQEHVIIGSAKCPHWRVFPLEH